MISQLTKDLQSLKNPEKAKIYQRFFKTGKGEYGEGDTFLGLTVPQQRKLVILYWRCISLPEIRKLLKSSFHEYRFTALAILVKKYRSGDEKEKDRIAKFYIQNRKGVNNWDLVDSSAPQILGDYLLERDRSILYQYAKSKNLWERRIAMLSTFAFINTKEYKDALAIAKILLHDDHDLIHKAVGWGLREIGKRDQAVEEKFLKKYYKVIPRTMLRYAIERFDEKKRKFYMGK